MVLMGLIFSNENTRSVRAVNRGYDIGGESNFSIFCKFSYY
jgi:hypothetical protein